MPYMYTSFSTNQTAVHWLKFYQTRQTDERFWMVPELVQGASVDIYHVPKGTSTNQRKLMKSRNCQRNFDTIAAIAWYMFKSYCIQRNFIDAQKSPQWIVHMYLFNDNMQ